MDVQGFLEIFPEFDCEKPARIRITMDLASCHVNQSAFGDTYESALAFLTAHELHLLKGSKGQQVSSTKVGDISKNFVTDTSSDGYFRQTIYGQRFLMMRDSISTSPIVLDGGTFCHKKRW